MELEKKYEDMISQFQSQVEGMMTQATEKMEDLKKSAVMNSDELHGEYIKGHEELINQMTKANNDLIANYTQNYEALKANVKENCNGLMSQVKTNFENNIAKFEENCVDVTSKVAVLSPKKYQDALTTLQANEAKALATYEKMYAQIQANLDESYKQNVKKLALTFPSEATPVKSLPVPPNTKSGPAKSALGKIPVPNSKK